MKTWKYKLTIKDYNKDGEEKEIIRSVSGEVESQAFNSLAFSLPPSVDIVDCEVIA